MPLGARAICAKVHIFSIYTIQNLKIILLRLLDVTKQYSIFKRVVWLLKLLEGRVENIKKSLRQTQGYIYNYTYTNTSCKTINSFQTLNFFNTFLIDGQGLLSMRGLITLG